MKIKNFIQSILLSICGISLALLAGEAFVRISTADQSNYVIEMWRYAKFLKVESSDPAIGHVHRPNQVEKLQQVDIRTNSIGLRGAELRSDDQVKHRVAVIGDSIALGWGVKENGTLSALLNKDLGNSFEVLNAGVGNMNLAQIIAYWGSIQPKLPVQTVVLLVSARAAEKQIPPSHNWLLQHSALAALSSTIIQRIILGSEGKNNLVDHYRELWSNNRNVVVESFARLRENQLKNNYRVIIVVIPEANDMKDYKFSFINNTVGELASKYNWNFIDPLGRLDDVDSANWHVSKNDIHLNDKAFNIISKMISPLIKEDAAVEIK